MYPKTKKWWDSRATTGHTPHLWLAKLEHMRVSGVTHKYKTLKKGANKQKKELEAKQYRVEAFDGKEPLHPKKKMPLHAYNVNHLLNLLQSDSHTSIVLTRNVKIVLLIHDLLWNGS